MYQLYEITSPPFHKRRYKSKTVYTIGYLYCPGFLIHEDQVFPNKDSEDEKLSDYLSDNWNLFVNILYILVNMLNMD